MTQEQEIGRRERKKLRTRQALVEAAVRLFAEQGYERTTIADIAEAADVSDRTFFLHFPAKEDILVGTSSTRQGTALRVVAERDADESPVQVLRRAMRAAIEHSWETDVATGVAAIRGRLVASNPVVQAKVLQRWMGFQTELSSALHGAFPNRLDPIDAAAAVGSVVGAAIAAAFASFGRGDTLEQTREAMDHAVDLAVGLADASVADRPAAPTS